MSMDYIWDCILPDDFPKQSSRSGCCDCCGDDEYLFPIGEDRICLKCLEGLYTVPLGISFAKAHKADFLQWVYMMDDTTFSELLVDDLWARIFKPTLANQILNPDAPREPLDWLALIKEYALMDDGEWAEWLDAEGVEVHDTL